MGPATDGEVTHTKTMLHLYLRIYSSSTCKTGTSEKNTIYLATWVPFPHIEWVPRTLHVVLVVADTKARSFYVNAKLQLSPQQQCDVNKYMILLCCLDMHQVHKLVWYQWQSSCSYGTVITKEHNCLTPSLWPFLSTVQTLHTNQWNNI